MLQEIENKLSNINEAVFQELCDNFLMLSNPNYRAFSRAGSQSGKQKTIKGTPDTFILLPNGNFLFVEYSTNLTQGSKKLKEDIDKCLNSEKTGIPVNRIAEIIICVNFRLTTLEIGELNEIVADTRINLTIHTLDSLALEIQLGYRNLGSLYLGLPMDSGQVVSIEQFIKEYNNRSGGVATSLSNIFIDRIHESTQLMSALDSHDLVILTGAPGVGKTRLAVETIKEYVSINDSFNCYCISYKNNVLFNDLQTHLKKANDYILFVDDANRIDAFSQIIGFFGESRTGRLKVVITVRDYAYQEIGFLCKDYQNVKIVIPKPSEEVLKEIITSSPFFVTDQSAQEKILSIANGNPRFAIMSATIFQKEKNMDLLHNVTDLFDTYFDNFVSDRKELGQLQNIKCLGIIAFFYTIPHKNRESIEQLLEYFGMEYSSFIDSIDILEQLEIVDIQFDRVKISEQNLSTYFFYRCFIKDACLDFYTLLTHYFENNAPRFKDTIIPANNTFGVKNVMDKVRPDLLKYLKGISGDRDRVYEFLSTFWFYLRTETLVYLQEYIDGIPSPKNSHFDGKYENNEFAFNNDDILKLLSEFFRYPTESYRDSLALAFEYVRKRPENFAELIHKIREQVTFDEIDFSSNFQRQFKLFALLIDGLKDHDTPFVKAFYEISKTFLQAKFQQTHGGRNMTIQIYTVVLPSIPIIHEFREKIWDAIDDNYEAFPEESFELLTAYGTVNPNASEDILSFDLPFVLRIIQNRLDDQSFEHCKYVHDQISWFRENDIQDIGFQPLETKFSSSLYEFYLKIDWNRYRDKESWEFDNHREYEQLKESEIRKVFVLHTESEADRFFADFTYIRSRFNDNWNYDNSLDIVVDENMKKVPEIGYYLFSKVIASGNDMGYIPRKVFINNLKTEESSIRIWKLIDSTPFRESDKWKLCYFDFLDESIISPSSSKLLLKTISELKGQITIHVDRLTKYLKLDPTLFKEILRITILKNKSEDTKLYTWGDLFEKHFEKLGSDIEIIKEAYLQQRMLQSHFDYHGDGLINILRQDPSFLIGLVENHYKNARRHGSYSREDDFSCVWRVEGIETRLILALDKVASLEPYYGVGEHFANSFFEKIPEEFKERAKRFIMTYAKENSRDVERMNMIVDIVRHSIRDIFEALLLQHIELNRDVEIFKEIWWRGNGGRVYSGDIIIGDIEAAEWRDIQASIQKLDIGIEILQIKKYVNDKIESALRSGDAEREMRFLSGRS